MKRIICICIFLWLLAPAKSDAQLKSDSLLALTLQQAIGLAQEHSPDILYYRHYFRSSYWNYCYYKANYRPSLSLNTTPTFNHWINAITQPDGTAKYIQQNQLETVVRFNLGQNIAFTGGYLYLQTRLQRLDVLGNNSSYSYNSTPLLIGYTQSLSGYNSLKWDKKIEPQRFEKAKRDYVQRLEYVARTTTSKFFNLANAQTNLEIARINFANADTLYVFAKGRYELGTMTENDMLQLEISKLNSESSLLRAELNLDDAIENLRSYLGITDAVSIEVIIDDDIPVKIIPVSKALEFALTNSPNMLDMEIRKMESDRNVASAKASVGINADLNMQFGLSQTGNELNTVYKEPLNQQYVAVGISVPILDWGRGKGRVQLAKSNRDMIYSQVEQERKDFEMSIVNMVKQFNLYPNQIIVASKTDRMAERRNEVARRLYILGKSTILELNASITDKDDAKRGYISALQSYWSSYYELRSLTLYDFEKDIPLTEDYDFLMK